MGLYGKFRQASDLLARACDSLETARQAVENARDHLITAVCIWEARVMTESAEFERKVAVLESLLKPGLTEFESKVLSEKPAEA